MPIDDTTTWHISYRSYTFPPEMTIPRQERIPYVEVPIQDENGASWTMCWARTWWRGTSRRDHRSHQEHLYEGDKVVIAYRQMLKEQIEIVQRGGDPMNVMRDPAENVPWVPTLEGGRQLPLKPRPGRVCHGGSAPPATGSISTKCPKPVKYIEDDVDRYCPDRELILKLYEEADRLMHR